MVVIVDEDIAVMAVKMDILVGADSEEANCLAGVETFSTLCYS